VWTGHHNDGRSMCQDILAIEITLLD